MRKSSVIIVALATIFAIFIGYNYIQDKEETVSLDAVKFEKEYETLNNRVNKNNNKVYPKVEISSNNVVKYSNYDEIIEIIKSGTGVIYLGYPECPWCRNVVPVLLSASEEVELDTIYYLNIKEDRDLLILDQNKKIITEKEGSKKYFELVEALDSILDEYILTDSKGNEVKTGKKRIYVPIVIFVKDGNIVAHHLDTVETQKDPYIVLTDRQQEELLLKFINYMSLTKGTICDERC